MKEGTMTTQSNKEDSAFKTKMKTICENLKRGIFSNPSCDPDIVFGPVPSRRLGHSLGLNNIKPKSCSYDCIYCQVGPTTCRSTSREIFLNPYELFCLVRRKIELLAERGIRIDYISFVPNGEPTLDLGLSKETRLLREFGYPIAVFTNSSLLWNDNVKEDLLFADYVSVKVDTVNEATWNTINRPHRRLRFQTILDGTADFSESFGGVLTTETMLVKNVNDTLDEVRSIGEYLTGLKRTKSYFAIPIRPPAERYAVAPDPYTLSEISNLVRNTIPYSEMLCFPEGDDFEGAGTIEEELLGILSVHPMTEETIQSYVRRKGGTAKTVRQMVGKNRIRAVQFEGRTFYMRTRQM
jgi:wyosine [tRNA(Phe)-imidazoG37] synthetase (radical SAM superfamily)